MEKETVQGSKSEKTKPLLIEKPPKNDIHITSLAVGPITISTKYDEQELKLLFPESEVEQYKISEDENEIDRDHLVISSHDFRLYIYDSYDEKIGFVLAEGPSISTQFGARIGDNFSKAFGSKANPSNLCVIPYEQAYLMCTHPEFKTIGVSIGGGWETGDKIPQSSAELDHLKIEEIWWKPKNL